jgi:hypothetical protein
VALTEACSKGGKAGLTAAARFIIKRKIVTGPSSSPKAHGLIGQADLLPSLDIGELGVVMEEQDQARPLPTTQGHRPLSHHGLGIIDERLGKAGLKSRRRARHKLPFGGMGLEVTMTPSVYQRLGIKPYAYF